MLYINSAIIESTAAESAYTAHIYASQEEHGNHLIRSEQTGYMAFPNVGYAIIAFPGELKEFGGTILSIIVGQALRQSNASKQ